MEGIRIKSGKVRILTDGDIGKIFASEGDEKILKDPDQILEEIEILTQSFKDNLFREAVRRLHKELAVEGNITEVLRKDIKKLTKENFMFNEHLSVANQENRNLRDEQAKIINQMREMKKIKESVDRIKILLKVSSKLTKKELFDRIEGIEKNLSQHFD